MCAFVSFGAGLGGTRSRLPSVSGRRPSRVRTVMSSVAETSSTSAVKKFLEAGGSLSGFIEKLAKDGVIPQQYALIFGDWYETYTNTIDQSRFNTEPADEIAQRNFTALLELCMNQMQSPYEFDLFHQSVREPYDFYRFGMDFTRPTINYDECIVEGRDNIAKIEEYLERGDNVIILSNHQSEAEPQAIDCVLRQVLDNTLGEKLIFMAGDRVREDLLAVPFTLGRNIVTVYSKKHMDDVPELKAEKQSHNKKTIQEVGRLFREGGKVLWLAPSGGRDRRSKETSQVEVSKFDPDAIETIRFVAARSGKPTHFFPMAVASYGLLPPPETVDVDMGEKRIVSHVPVNLWFGEELDMASLAPADADKHEQREIRANAVMETVKEGYSAIRGYDQ
uniref:Phospholipid/glycerol acyltransferase domain-containing protein n=1 Tax=Rhodosorus marinus TaxID=101924 RepID=A0A7S2ZID5_9RHOD|mmetsp:Transcript_20675/g.83904  ORF Transcript_20675/g.83904 Transcript_20675/m.83904 type:complete len:392 (+) Transcript_20675:126-1301(+)